MLTESRHFAERRQREDGLNWPLSGRLKNSRLGRNPTVIGGTCCAFGQDMAERHRVVQLEVVPRKFWAFVFFFEKAEAFLFPKEKGGRTFSPGWEFVLKAFDRRFALTGNGMRPHSNPREGPGSERGLFPKLTASRSCSGDLSQERGLLAADSAKEADRPTESPGGLASLPKNRYYNGMRF